MANTYCFEYGTYYNEITPALTYQLMNLPDIAPEARIPIKTIAPLLRTCRYSAVMKEKFRTMIQPSNDWLEVRDAFLTSSRFPHISGSQPQRFGTPLKYWREVTGRAVAPPFSEQQTFCVNHGNRYEPEARSLYERLFNVKVHVEGLRILDVEPWIYSASSDGLINNDPENQGIIEIKCNALGDPRDTLPDHYIDQMMGAMAVYRAPFCDFINYWVREGVAERVFYCCRLYFSERYWRALKLRLDYMAWCIVEDRAPVGMGELMLLYPLPRDELVIEERIIDISPPSEPITKE